MARTYTINGGYSSEKIVTAAWLRNIDGFFYFFEDPNRDNFESVVYIMPAAEVRTIERHDDD